MPRGKRAEKPGSSPDNPAQAEPEKVTPATTETTGAETADESNEASADARRNWELTDDERLALLHHHKKKIQDEEKVIAEAKAAAKSAKQRQKVIYALALKECGGEADDEIKDLIHGETPTGEAEIKATLERHARVLSWLGVPVGTQMTFDDVKAGPDAFSEGKLAGIRGEVCKPPHDPGSDAYGRWIEGWHEGQGCLASGIKKLKEQRIDDGDDEGGEGGDELAGQVDLEEAIEAAGDMPGSPAPMIDTSERPFGLPADENEKEEAAAS